jgi:hypothetical protein
MHRHPQYARLIIVGVKNLLDDIVRQAVRRKARLDTLRHQCVTKLQVSARLTHAAIDVQDRTRRTIDRLQVAILIDAEGRRPRRAAGRRQPRTVR